MDRTPDTIVTRVGHAGFGDNQFGGFGMLGELAGNDGYWSLMSLAVGGKRLSWDESRVLDDVCVCGIAADPRIWPLKIVRLVGSFGTIVPAFCAGYFPVQDAIIGPWNAGAAAEFFENISRALVSETDASVARVVESILETGGRIRGFGVPFRKQDERVGMLTECLDRYGRTSGRYWSLMLDTERALLERKGIRVNIAGATAAACLDLGYTPLQIRSLTFAMSACALLANAVEEAEQRNRSLRRLPKARVEYIGAPPRSSPRRACPTKP
jgi:hypothetical protein